MAIIAPLSGGGSTVEADDEEPASTEPDDSTLVSTDTTAPAVQEDDATDGFDLRYVSDEDKGRIIRTEEGTTRAEAAVQASEEGVIDDTVIQSGGNFYTQEGEDVTTAVVDTKQAVGGTALGTTVQTEADAEGTIRASNPETGETATGVQTTKKVETSTGTHYTTTTTIGQDGEVVSTGQEGETVGQGPGSVPGGDEVTGGDGDTDGDRPSRSDPGTTNGDGGPNLVVVGAVLLAGAVALRGAL